MGNKDFLQSEAWRRFQEAAGRRTFLISDVSIIEHALPIVGKYFYVPRGDISGVTSELIKLAKKEKAGWVRIDVSDAGILKTLSVQKGHQVSIKKAPHDMQPKEIFVIDLVKSEEELLSEMKSKTRYNIKLAEKKGVKVTSESRALGSTLGSRYFEDFLRLVRITAKRDGITPHPDEYYQKMLEVIPEENLRLYIAEFEGKIIAANLVVFYDDTATYLHGASDNENRNVMAPFLLQWRQIQDAKKAGYTRYDFGGVRTTNHKLQTTNWSGITRFKTGFSPNTQALEFPGSYDIILNSKKYYLYRVIQYLKNLL